MNFDVSITIKPNNEKNEELIKSEILKEIQKKDIKVSKDGFKPVFIKKSIDARHGHE